MNEKQKKQEEKKRKRQEFIEELALRSSNYLSFFIGEMLIGIIVVVVGLVNGVGEWWEAILFVIIIGIVGIVFILIYNRTVICLKKKSKDKGFWGFLGNNLGFIIYTIIIIVTFFTSKEVNITKENSEKIIQLSWTIEAISLGLFVALHFIIVKMFEDKREKVLTKVTAEKNSFIRKYNVFNYNDALRAQNWIIFYIIVSIIANLIGSFMVMFYADAIENSSVMQGFIFMAGCTTLMSMGLISCVSLMLVVFNNKKLRIQAEDYEKESEKVAETIPSQSEDQSTEKIEPAASVDDSNKKQEKADEVSDMKMTRRIKSNKQKKKAKRT